MDKEKTELFIGRRLKFLRDYNDMTCQQMADILGVSKQAVSRFETGDLNPSNLLFKRICETLKVSPEFFTKQEITVNLKQTSITVT